MKKLLIVVDYQVDFVSGSLGFDLALGIESKIADKIKSYHEKNYDVLFTMDTHSASYSNTQEGKNLPVPHCIKGTDGWDLFGKIKALKSDKDVVLEKNTFGCAELFPYLANKEYDSIELVGVVSNICVISNAIIAKTALPECKIIVDASCIASNDNALNKAAVSVMESLQIDIINKS